MVNSSSSISNKDAIIRVAQQMNYSITGRLAQRGYGSKFDPNRVVFTDGGISKVPIPVKKVYYARAFEKPILAWQLSIYEVSGENWYNFYVNAETGEILTKNNWKTTCGLSNHECSDTSHKTNTPSVTASFSGNENSEPFGGSAYNVFALPLENPFFGPRTLEVDPHNLIASPFGWHDTNGSPGAEFTVTRGNNVNAYEDGDNIGYQPDGGATLNFDYPFNPVFSFSDQSEDAAITNLFYWNNIIHDIVYLYGFDEESGNFQVNNYNGLGLGNDEVNAEAQDGSGSCNANFFSPPDGTSGVMQMYTCDFRDGDFDNHVVIHEYGHGISIRLTGGGSNSDCLFNDEQMGEGWSDWYATVFTMTASDLPTDLRPVGNWLFGQDQDGSGIRDFPYTTDLSQDPRTYDYIKTTFGPHPLGSTWAAMLWELTWGLIDEHGFDPDVYNGTGGNNIAIALVTEGLKLQPCNPGFVDGRDAILAADLALYGGANQCIIWDAFAKRGLGFSADQGSSDNRTDGVEAFDSPTTNLNIEEDSFCFFESSVVLGGGLPIGGVYSGPGVTDNGDGITFTFNPAAVGEGVHTVTYTATSICSNSGTATDTIEVTNGAPEIICQDITLSLDSSDTVTIVPEDIVTNFLPGDGYTLDQSGTFNPEDISASSSEVTLSDDQVSNALPIGFDFNFYQNTYSDFYISSNGFITFNPSGVSGCCSGQNLPNGSTPNNLIAFAWDDLYPPGNGSIRYATIGTAPNRVLVVDVVDIPFCCNSTAEVTTQVKLFEGSNVIEIHSTDVSGTPMTQGIENMDGTLALAVPNRNSEAFAITNDYVAFIPNTGSFPDNCGLETTVTIDIDTFDCANIGDNLVTATVTDTNGNTASCTATVTILPNSGAELDLTTTLYCEDEGVLTGLTGGTPAGGTYSGPGVTDDGNGTTFTLDPAIAGAGIHTVSYSTVNSCGTVTSNSQDIEVQPAIPEIVCQDITLALDLNGTATIEATDLLLGGDATGMLYALNPFSANSNIALYDYDAATDAITVDANYTGSTQIERNYAMDNDPSSGEVYILSGTGSSSPRQLFSFDIETGNGGAQLVETIVSVTGNTNPQSMAFGPDGTLYFAFSNGEINAYNIATQSMSAFSTVSASGAVGLTYDYDNNRLIHSTGNGSVALSAIDLSTGTASSLFGVSPGCGAQAIEYVGDKLIASSTASCNKVYIIDLNTQSATDLLSPSQTFSSIKDFMYLGGLPVDNCNGQALTFTLDQDSFTCADIGANTVTVTATDAQGNQTSCSAVVTVSLPESSELTFDLATTIFCEDEGVLSGLTGGSPSGGVYSGAGVTDDGNGTTFTLDPAIAGVGIHTITYSLDSCGTLINTTVDIEVQPAIPDIVCQDITLALDLNGTATIEATDLLLGGDATGMLYALNPFSANSNIALYDYDAATDAITVDANYTGSTQIARNYAMDNDPSSGEVYILSGTGSSSPRQLFSFDIETGNGGAQLVETIVSVTGNTNPQSMAFGSDGTLYFAFSNGEINAYNIATQSMSAFSTVSASGAVGLTYDYDNNRLIHSTGNGSVALSAIDLSTGTVSSLFGVSPGCGAQAIEYVGDKLIASSTSGCNKVYIIDLNTQSATDLLAPSGTFTSIKDFMYLGGLPVDNCNGQALTFTLDQDSFTCADIGANTVTVTATDTQGNQTSCSAVVTVSLPESSELTFDLATTIFCEDEGLLSGLTGGSPSGGVYSGAGVTDDGNGTTFTLDPAIAGVGIHTITYSLDSCGTLINTTVDIEVQSAIPDIACQDITLALDENGIATLEVLDVLLGGDALGSLYAMDPFSATNNIALYEYDPTDDTISIDASYNGSTQINRNFSMDNDPTSGTVYIMSATSSSAARELYSFDIETGNGGAQLIGAIASVTGDTNPQSMAFGPDGTLYFAFNNGEINAYNVSTQTMTAFSNVSGSGAVGLTYDYDNNRLIHTAGSGTVTLSAIDLATGTASSLFSVTPGCGAQAIEYVGDKLIASSTSGCNKVYIIDLNTQSATDLLAPSGTFTSIKDFMYLGGLPVDNCNGQALTFTLDQDSFACADIGDNTVTVTATDVQGNQTSCTAVVTIVDDMGPELSCVSNLNVVLDETGSATIDENNLIISASDNCSSTITYSISQTEFSCNDLQTPVDVDLVSNGSFENGITNWTSTVINGNDGSGSGSCEIKWLVDSDSQSICCCVGDIFPTDGALAAFSSFDNGIANTLYRLEQVIDLSTLGEATTLSFDWAGEFDLLNATQNRVFNVEFRDLSENLIDTVYDYQIPYGAASSISESVTLDVSNSLVSYIGQTIKLVFVATIPETFAGPSKAMIDNVSMTTIGESNQVSVTIQAEDASGNISTCQTLVQVLDPDSNCDLSVNTFDSDLIRVFPNPFKDALSVTWSSVTLDKLEIYDVLGKLVHKTDLKNEVSNVSIPTTDLSNGFYILRITSGNRVFVKQLIKN